MNNSSSLIRKIDSIQLYVDDLDAGLAFYRDALGQRLVWRTSKAAGLGVPDGDGELVVQVERPGLEVDLLVEAVEPAVARFQSAGGNLLTPIFTTQIGLGAVVEDPWGNVLVLLDASKGLLRVDEQGNILGNLPPKR